MIAEGTYISKTTIESFDWHAGRQISGEVYRYLCFYEGDNYVGYYEAGRNFFKRFISKQFEYDGEYSLTENSVKISIINSFDGRKNFYEGEILGDELILESISKDGSGSGEKITFRRIKDVSRTPNS